MSPRCRSAIAMLLILVAVGALGCKSSGPRATTAPPPEVRPVATPTPAPVAEEEIEQPETATIPSVEVKEELPQDLVLLNERGYLKDVFFDTDSYELRPEARDQLAANAAWLQQYPSVRVLIEGHCDERNTREYNVALGERRANAVREYLVFLGIGPQRIQTISYGEERPFAQGHTEAAWQLNRRAHFVITAR